MIEIDLKKLEAQTITELNSIKSNSELDQVKSRILGKQSPLSRALKSIPSLPIEQRAFVGKQINLTKQKLTSLFQSKYNELEAHCLSSEFDTISTDFTLPPSTHDWGTIHPINQTIADIVAIFNQIGYSVKEGPDIETETYNFDKLNIPKNHPSRDMHDTFFVASDFVLRTHTSPVQIRTMLSEKPPIRILAPGKVFRCDSDATHSPVFHQMEGLYVDKSVTFSDLKGTLTFFLNELFGSTKNIRFRPSYFPFTEPSTEVDVTCMKCDGRGCSLCKHTGWLEILGAGLVNRNVFRSVDINPDEYRGFAFGMGIERIAMLRYEIPDIKLFYENNLQFIRQF